MPCLHVFLRPCPVVQWPRPPRRLVCGAGFGARFCWRCPVGHGGVVPSAWACVFSGCSDAWSLCPLCVPRWRRGQTCCAPCGQGPKIIIIIVIIIIIIIIIIVIIIIIIIIIIVIVIVIVVIIIMIIIISVGIVIVVCIIIIIAIMLLIPRECGLPCPLE